MYLKKKDKDGQSIGKSNCSIQIQERESLWKDERTGRPEDQRYNLSKEVKEYPCSKHNRFGNMTRKYYQNEGEIPDR